MYMDSQNQLDFHVHTNINRKGKDIAAGGPQVHDLSQTQLNSVKRQLLHRFVFEVDINGVFGRFFFR